MAKLTLLTNSFHHTEYRTRLTRAELDAIAYRVVVAETATEAEKATMRRIRRALCGMDDCTCATTHWGER